MQVIAAAFLVFRWPLHDPEHSQSLNISGLSKQPSVFGIAKSYMVTNVAKFSRCFNFHGQFFDSKLG